tara:strand:+ start:3964 stop:4380 length:417 start_codon:yes stop_codon:yes gene_type:complete
MKVKLGQIYAANPILGKLVEQQLPIRVAYRLTRLITKLNDEYDALDTSRIKLLEEYGTPVDGVEGQFQFTPENQVSFQEEFNNLLSEDVDLDWQPISIDDLGRQTNLSVKELSSIGFLFQELEDLYEEEAEETVEATV